MSNFSFIYSWYCYLYKIINRFIVCPMKKGLTSKCGYNVKLGPGVKAAGWENISFGNNVFIGEKSLFLTTRARLIFGNNIMTGPNITIVTGNHRTDLMGRYMIDVTNSEKLKENDQDVIFEGDNWIGANATILKGCIIGTGSIIAAGAVVKDDVPRYSIVGGVPAKVISYRFDKQQIKEHERILGIKSDLI